MTPRAPLWLLILALAAPATRADPIYVVEQLVVSVASSPEADAERIGQVKSGDKLELLERQGDQTHVRLPNGKEGWIKASYVSAEEPLAVRLTERTADNEKLKQENAKLKEDVGRLQSQLAASRSATSAAATADPSSSLTAPAAEASPPVPARETVFLRPGQTPWAFLLGVAAVMLLVGFLLGWTTLDRRIRQKYGGLRIY
jgi:Bacterial SH3 domain